MKKIDVIIPAYKAQNTIVRTLSSIAMQSLVNELNVVIVNDADGIGYKKYIDMFKSVMTIKEITLEKNGGPGVARQKGIDSTDSLFFTCIDADDTFSNAFSLELLLNNIENKPEFIMVVGNFIEQHPNLKFINHPQDLVWMFGKVYRRSFIQKYGVKFNETRANEDNGFNTWIRLIASPEEKINFINDTVYFWHHKEDSITRINNNQYSYDQSFVGYTDNMIWAIQNAKKIKPFNNYIDMWAIQCMAQLYIYYYQTVKRDPRFIEQNFKYCKKFYNEIFKKYIEMSKEQYEPIFAEVLSQQSINMKDFVADKTIYQFIETLK